MTQSLAQFAARAKNLGPDLQSNLKRGINAAALHTKRSVEAEMASAGVGKRLSGVGTRGARIGVRYDVKGTDNPVALVRATGPFHLVERSTKAHAITPKKRGRRVAARKKALNIPGVGARASAQHPGTRGKHAFAKGVERAKPGVRRIIGESVVKALRG